MGLPEKPSPLPPEIVPLLFLGPLAFGASVVASVAGYGAAIILTPFLVQAYGVRDTVPILAVTMLLGNLSRAWWNRDELQKPVAAWFALGAVPAAVVGALTFVNSPAALLTKLLGASFLVILVYRRTGLDRRWRIARRGFFPVGLVTGFLSGLVGNVGPLTAPFFLNYGLVRAAYIGTEAVGVLSMNVTKLLVFGASSLVSPSTAAIGLTLGGVMFGGSFAGRLLIRRVSDRAFVFVVEAVLLVAGLRLLLV